MKQYPDTPLTAAQAQEMIQPLYEIIGGMLAAIVITLATLFVFFGLMVIWKRIF